MKRLVSFLLSVATVLALIPCATVSIASEGITEPTVNHTVPISDTDAFLALLGDGKTAENTKYVLEADVDLGGKDVTATPFILKNSVFDGGDHTVTGFTMDSAGTSSPTVGGFSMGLFRMDSAQSNTAVIKNLKLGSDTDKIVIVNKNWGWASGALLGAIPAGTQCRIENVDAYVNYTHTDANGAKIAGALVGCSAGTLEMDGCTSNGTVYCLLNDNNIRGVGGMIGWISAGDATVSSCTNNAAVGGYKQLGGIVGFVQADLTVTDCTNNGAISGTQTLGGIAGYITGSGISVAVTDCTNNGSMTGNFCGGIVSEFRGVAEANVTNCRNNGGINDVEAVSDAVTHCGGLIAKADGNLSVTGCTNGGNVKAINTAGGIIAQNVGAITIENSTNKGNVTATTSTKAWHGAGGFVAYTNSNVTVRNSANEGTVSGQGFAGGAIGSCDTEKITLSLEGFDNRGAVSTVATSAGGCIGNAQMNQGSVIVQGCSNYGTVKSEAAYAGGIVGISKMPQGSLTVTDSLNAARITGKFCASGVVAAAQMNQGSVTVTAFFNRGELEATGGFAGGAVGDAAMTEGSVTITDLLNTAKITSTSAASAGVGIASTGDNQALTISALRLVNLGNIYGKWNVGAVTGYSKSATLSIKDCICSASMSTSDKKADVFAKYSTGTEEGVAAATVTAENNVFTTAANLNNTEAEQKKIADVLTILTTAENGYKFGPYKLNSAKNKIIVIMPPVLKGCQLGTERDGMKSLRLVGVLSESLDYKEVGFHITVDGGESSTVKRSSVFYALKAKNEDGGIEEYTAQSLGGSYVYALSVDIPAEGTHEITAVPYSIGTDGTVYTGTGYTLTLTDGAFVVAAEIKA